MPSIEEMKEISKSKFTGTPFGNIVQGAGKVAEGVGAIPRAVVKNVADELGTGIANTINKSVSAVTGLKPNVINRSPDNMEPVKGYIKSGMDDMGRGFGAIGAGIQNAAVGAGFGTKPTILSEGAKFTGGKITGSNPNGIGPVTEIPGEISPTKTAENNKLIGYPNKSSQGTMTASNGKSYQLGTNPSEEGDVSGGKNAYTFGPGMQPIGAVGSPEGSAARPAYNPNDAKLDELMKQLEETSSTGKPSVERLTKIKALQGAIGVIAPQTSYGNFGVAGMGNETTRRGQDVSAETTKRGQDVSARGQDLAAETAATGHKLTARGQDITAETTKRGQDIAGVGTEATADYHRVAAEEKRVTTDYLKEQGKPDKVADANATNWARERMKFINTGLAEIDPNAPEEVQAKAEATLKDRFDRNNTPPEKKRIKNADGTVTVIYANGKQKIFTK
jgi:hypothetical protein